MQALPCAQQGLTLLPLADRHFDRPLHHLPTAYALCWWHAHWPDQVAGQAQCLPQARCLQVAPQAVALGPPAPVRRMGLGASWELGWAPLWLLVGQQVVLHLVGHLQQAQQCLDWCQWEPFRQDLGPQQDKPAHRDDVQGIMRKYLRQAVRAPQQSQAQGSSGRTLHAGPECTGPAAQVNSQPWQSVDFAVPEAAPRGTCEVTRSRGHSARTGRGTEGLLTWRRLLSMRLVKRPAS